MGYLQPQNNSLNRVCIWVLGALALSTLLTHPQILHAQDSADSEDSKPIYYFDLPGQALSSSLIELAVQAEISIFVPQDLVLAYQSTPVIGRFTVETALAQILAKSPLTFDYTSDGNSIIIQAITKIETPTEQEELPSPALQIEEVRVTSRQFPFRYQTITESSVIHPGMSHFDTSRYLNTLPDPLIKDLYPLDLMDALKNSSGVTPGDGLAGSNDDFFLRGFPRNSVYIDKFRLGSDVGVKFSMSNMERVEVLKGPSTLNFGQSEPGGVVNIIPKKPQQKSSLDLNVDAGNAAYRRLAIDSTGSLSKTSKDLLYRFNFDGTKQDESANFKLQERISAAGSVSWTMNPDNVIDMSYKVLDSTYINPQNTIILVPTGNGELELLQANVPANQPQNHYDASFGLLNISWIHYLSQAWSLEAKYFHQNEKRDGIRVNSDSLLTSTVLVDPDEAQPIEPQFIFVSGQLVPVTTAPTNITGGSFNHLEAVQAKSIFDEYSEVEAQLASVQLQGSDSLLGMMNHTTVGMDFRNEVADSTITFQQRDDFKNIVISDSGVDIFFHEGDDPIKLITRSQRLNYTDFGLYAQNNLELTDPLILSIGGRYTYTEGYSKDLVLDTREALPTFHDFSMQAGLVYKFQQDTSVYFNYSEAMKANYRIDDVGSRLDKPELSNQLELGIKQLCLNDKLMYTASVYHIVKENIASFEYENGLRTAVLGDSQFSKGAELDFTFQHNSQLNFVGSLSYIDAGFRSGQYVGNKPALVSNMTASLYGDWSFSRGALRGFRTSLGAYYVGERYGDNKNIYYIDPYATIDGSIKYAKKLRNFDIELSLFVKNITNETFISSMEGQLRTMLGEQRRVISSVQLHF